MEFKDLEIFHTVARTGSMTSAAKQLGFVQSHITGRIRRLEEELQHKLFKRLKTGVTLTAEGKQLYPYVESLLVQWNETRNLFLDSDELLGSLRLGSLETTASLYAADWITNFHRKNPSVEISLETGTTKQLLQRVVNGALDIALVAGYTDNLELDSKALILEELSIITPLGETPNRMLLENQVILTFREGCTYRQVLERWMNEHGVGSFRTIESASIDTILKLTAGGLGISIMPKSIVIHSPLSGQLTAHPIDKSIGLVTTYAVWRRGRRIPQTISAFLENLAQLSTEQYG